MWYSLRGTIAKDFTMRDIGMNKNNEERWIGVEEAAQYLGVKPSTIRDWIKKTSIPANKIGKQWKFKINELDEWIKSGKSAI